jgi:hypothetical protein
LAFLHEAFLCGAGKPPAVPPYRLRLTGVALAFLQKARFRGTREGLPLPAHGSALASTLRGCRGEIQRQQQCRQKHQFHVSPPFTGRESALRVVDLSLDLVHPIIFRPFRSAAQVYLPACSNEGREQEFDKRRLLTAGWPTSQADQRFDCLRPEAAIIVI